MKTDDNVPQKDLTKHNKSLQNTKTFEEKSL